MSGLRISNRFLALILMAVATVWALAERAPIWLVAVLALPPLLFGSFAWWTERRPPTPADDDDPQTEVNGHA